MKMLRRLVAVLAIVLSLGSGVVGASAAESPDRAEYVAQLEGFCRPGAERTQVVMRGAKADLKSERLAVAAGKFGKTARIFGGTLTQMTAVPRPSADTARLATWFGYLERQESYLGQITSRLRAGKAIVAQRLTARFIHDGNLANNTVIAFGFDYCRFRFSRYG